MDDFQSTPLSDDPSFLDRLSDLDRGLEPEGSVERPPEPSKATAAPAVRSPLTAKPTPLRLRTHPPRRVILPGALPPSITAPFEAMTVPEAAEPTAPPASTESAAPAPARPLLELFPRPAVAAPSLATVATAPSGSGEPDLADAAVAPSPYEAFYGLREKPFALSTDPRCFYHSTPHDAVSQQLLSAIRDRDGLVVLTGDMGAGKTTLCRVVIEQLDRRTLTSLVGDPTVAGEEMLRKVLADFGVSRDERARGAAATSRDLVGTLRSFVESLASLEARAVVIVDEAHGASAEVLEQIRTLAELADASSHLQIVLVGQPELAALLHRPDNRTLQQRVAVRIELGPLPPDEVGNYVVHRLAIAGGSPRLQFEDSALARIHRLSQGVPRVVNLLCDRALARGAAAAAATIDAAIIDGAADDLDLGEPQSRSRRIGLALVVAVGLTLCLIAGAALAALLFRDRLGRAVTHWQQRRVAVEHILPPAAGVIERKGRQGRKGRYVEKESSASLAASAFHIANGYRRARSS